MLIVLEGCDGSGKTTLANTLAPILGAEIIHYTTETPNTYAWFNRVLEMSQFRNIIADRFCYGQFVYQDAEDRSLSQRQLHEIELMMVNYGAKVVYVKASEDVINKRLQKRAETTAIPIDKIQKRYDELFNKSMMTVLEYNTSSFIPTIRTYKKGAHK